MERPRVEDLTDVRDANTGPAVKLVDTDLMGAGAALRVGAAPSCLVGYTFADGSWCAGHGDNRSTAVAGRSIGAAR